MTKQEVLSLLVKFHAYKIFEYVLLYIFLEISCTNVHALCDLTNNARFLKGSLLNIHRGI